MDSITSAVSSTLEKLHLHTPTLEPSLPVPTQEQVSSLRAKYAKQGQEHVFTFWDSSTPPEQAQLYKQLETLDPARLTSISETVLQPNTDPKSPIGTEHDPIPDEYSASILDASPETAKKWYDAGLKAIAAGEVAVLLMAGGQGTRLGSTAPKGCYDIGLPSGKSLFQLRAERLVKLQELAAEEFGERGKGCVIPWYIMTSGPTRKDTEDFLKSKKYFGLKGENVIIFEQGVLPCLTHDGKIIMEEKNKVAVAPDGNGGLYLALITNGMLTDLHRRNIKHVHAYCVDNCLVRIADPTFIGYSLLNNLSIATKVVRKRSPEEPVGLVVLKDGKPGVIEYSEISEREAHELAPAATNGNTAGREGKVLRFRAANIVNHYYSMDFLSGAPHWSMTLPHHIARKKIPYTDLSTGEKTLPSTPNGIKLEQFVFDVFDLVPLSKFGLFEVDRKEEFSPLKNGLAAKEDNPVTSRRDVLLQGRRWVEAVGGVVLDDGDKETGVEISPLVSYAGEGLEFLRGKEVKAPAVIMDKFSFEKLPK